MTARKRWMITYRPTTKDSDIFPSKKKCYEFVQHLTNSYRGQPDAPLATIWVDEGNGWQRYEDFDLAELAAAPAVGGPQINS